MAVGENHDRIMEGIGGVQRGLGRVEGKVDRIIADQTEIKGDIDNLHGRHNRLKDRVDQHGRRAAYMAGGAAGFGAIAMKAIDWLFRHGSG